MRFRVISNSAIVPSEATDIGYLWMDNWNDWYKYRTLYVLTYFDADGAKHEIGNVKIGEFDWSSDQDRPNIPNSFQALGEEFFSLGQDNSYYSTIANLPSQTRQQLLTALRDVVAEPALYERALNEDVMGVSLLRSVTPRSIEGQFRRILGGGAILTPYHFRYQGPLPESTNSNRTELDFEVEPESRPPTNVHVLIGRNGVGKTYLLNRMTRALVRPNESSDENGFFTSIDRWFDEQRESPFANVLSVTFSAFDDFALVPERRNALRGVLYSNVGLRKRIKDRNDEWVTITRDPSDLAEDFSNSAKLCLRGEKARLWKTALTTLQTESLFEDEEIGALAEFDDDATFSKYAKQLFRRLSSGHKIVLLTITKLVEKVEEKTLVLMAEPEAHLHPPLLSAFVRALSDLLIDRNGVAIIATHSPVVVQEVPAKCVWKIVKHGGATRADRPETETFAENVGVLTREAFGLEVSRSGFNRMLTEAVGPNDTIEDVLNKFDNEVGSEGSALISSTIASSSRIESE